MDAKYPLGLPSSCLSYRSNSYAVPRNLYCSLFYNTAILVLHLFVQTVVFAWYTEQHNILSCIVNV